MTLSELKYIIALSKTRHFRKASEMCFISQPTLSVAVKKLEEELEVTIFERKKQDLIVTPIGKKIITIAEEILEKTDLIKTLAKESNGEIISELRIGVIYTIAPYLLPKLVPIFREIAPNIPLVIEENFTHVLADKLQSGELDIVILSLPFSEPNIETQAIYEEPFKLLIPNQHPLAQGDDVLDLAQIEDETFLLLGAGHCFRDQVLENYPNLMHLNYQSDRLHKTFESSSLETIRYMVSSGMGMSIFPCSSLSKRDEGLFQIRNIDQDGKKSSRTVALAWRKTFPRIQVLDLLKESISKVEIPCVKSLIN
jgi:LysR family hydrogen peroxide-inducible transcriptional activator